MKNPLWIKRKINLQEINKNMSMFIKWSKVRRKYNMKNNNYGLSTAF